MKKFEETLRRVREDETLVEALRIYDIFTVCVSLYAFIYIIASAWQKDVWLMWKVAAVLAAPFAIVSLLRYLLKAPRPYDVFGLGHPSGKERRIRHGAFPSRHVFSAACLGCVMLAFSPLFGGILLGLAALLAVDRVLLGFHFPRDVVAGYLAGVLSGTVGLVVLHFI